MISKKKVVNQIQKSRFGYALIIVIFNVYEKITRYSILKSDFKKTTGYNLDLKNPASFNQKISWKKIYDRNPLLPIAADKYRVRKYLKTVLGTENAEKILIPLLFVTDKPETIPFDTLPDEYVIKATHGSGTNIIVTKDTSIDKQQIITQLNDWLNRPFGVFRHEWAYQQVERKIIIEKLIKDEKGHLPFDYKFHMLNGSCLMIQVNQGLYWDQMGRKVTLFSPNWDKLDVKWEYQPTEEDIVKPDNFDSMHQLAKELAKHFDYIRVDLYSIDGSIYFGELTNYPSNGTAVIDPLEFDFELGLKWNLLPRYWENNY